MYRWWTVGLAWWAMVKAVLAEPEAVLWFSPGAKSSCLRGFSPARVAGWRGFEVPGGIQGTVEVDLPEWAAGPYRDGRPPYDPDLDDGVKVNLLPIQEAGLLPVKKVV